jgi:hypothetical protein
MVKYKDEYYKLDEGDVAACFEISIYEVSDRLVLQSLYEFFLEDRFLDRDDFMQNAEVSHRYEHHPQHGEIAHW